MPRVARADLARASRRRASAAAARRRESPEWMPASSTCCMIAADPDVLAVAERVDVDLDRVLEEAVEEDLAARARRASRAQVVREAVARVDDLHRPAAEHVARAHEQREADLVGRARAPRSARRARSRTAAPCSRAARAARRSARGPRPGRSPRRCVPSSGTPASPRPAASFSGVWPPNWTITPSGCSTSTTPSTSSSVSGSKYRRSEVS